jgi:hypothetical protein
MWTICVSTMCIFACSYGFNFCRLLKWEKLGLQNQLIRWCQSTKPLLAARLHPELLILHLDGEYYERNFSASALSCDVKIHVLEIL